jgi:hypothetical protein
VFAFVAFTIKVNAKAVPMHTAKAYRERRGEVQLNYT